MVSAARKSTSRNGLSRHATAPCSTSLGRTASSACPVMKTIGIDRCRRPKSALEVGAAHARHGDVEDQATRLAEAIGRQELLRRRERLDREPEHLQQVGQRLPRRLVVIDQRDERTSLHPVRPLTTCSPGARATGRRGCRSRLSASRGMKNENVAPGPSFGSAHSMPPWLSMMERLTDRPIPMPSLLVV